MIGKSKSIAHGMVALNYAINKKGAEVILTNNLSSYNAKSIYEEMIRYHSTYSNSKNRFIRTEVSPHPSNGRKLSVKDFERIARTIAKKMALEKHQWVAVIHNDTKNPHLHMIFNRADYQMNLYNDSFISNRTSRAAEEVAYEMELIQAKDIGLNNPKNELDSTKKYLKEKFSLALKHAKTYGEFIKLLENEDVKALPARHKKTGQIYGHIIAYNGEYYKASKVDRKLSYRNTLKVIEQNKREYERLKNRNFTR